MIMYLFRVPELEVEEENQVQEMTLDEWKNLQEQTRPKPEFNIRKPESTVPSKAVVIHKSRYRDDVSLSQGNLYCWPHEAHNSPVSVGVEIGPCYLAFLFSSPHHQNIYFVFEEYMSNLWLSGIETWCPLSHLAGLPLGILVSVQASSRMMERTRTWHVHSQVLHILWKPWKSGLSVKEAQRRCFEHYWLCLLMIRMQSSQVLWF